MKHLTPEAKAAYDHLTASDPVMSALLEGREPLVLAPTNEYFFTLVDAICSQQLSSKVAARRGGRAPWCPPPPSDSFSPVFAPSPPHHPPKRAPATLVSRTRALAPKKETREAEDIAAIPDETLRGIGLSWRKVSYVKD